MNNMIMKTIAGSHLYGTNVEGSDIDYRGICFEPIQSILGMFPFEQYIHPVGDETIYGLRKFTQLALDNNPNIVELLFVPKPIYENAYWTEIVNHRYSFLSTRIAKTFVGYAVSQAKRIEGHHKWMTGEVPVKPDPKEYGRIIQADGTEKWTDHQYKNQYDNAHNKYQQYQTWLAKRNPTRHDLEEKWGYDTKHGMHLVRLLQQGVELLQTGFLTLPRPNADELLSIRNGLLTYEKLMEFMRWQISVIDDLVDESVLPSNPDVLDINALVTELNYTHVKRSYP